MRSKGDNMIYYLVNDKKYLDVYQITQRLCISKSDIQYLSKRYPINQNEILRHQNRNLYSLESILHFVKQIKSDYEREIEPSKKSKVKEV